MAAAAPEVTAMMNAFGNASGKHVDEFIKLYKESQRIKAKAEANKMSTTGGVVKSRSKKERSKQEKGKGPKRPLNSWMAFRSKSLKTLSSFY